MDERLAALERKVSELTRAVASIEGRLGAIEERLAAPPGSAADAGRAPGETARGGPPADVTPVTVLALVGRICLVLGGAYLLRALTDAGTLPRAVGTLLGIVYAVAWLGFADRLGAARRWIVAPFYGFATAVIAFPILWEALRNSLLSPERAALLMAVVTGLALAVAWRRRIQSLAWIMVASGLAATLLFLLVVPWPPTPFGFYLAFLGVATLWMGYSLDWIWLRWPVAFVADVTVLAMAGSVTGVWQRAGAPSVMVLQLVLFAAYLVSFAARTLWRSRDVIPFEVVQTAALLVVGFGGAVYVMQETGAGAAGLGAASLAFGVGCYGVAFAFVNWREGRWKNFVFYNSLAVVFTLAGIWLTAASATQSIVWACLAVAAAALGHRYSAIALGSHAAAYVVAGAIASGLFALVADAFTASAGRAWAGASLPAYVVLAAAAGCAAIPVSTGHEAWNRYSRVPQVVVVLTLLCGVGAAAIAFVVPALAGAPGAGADPAVVAAARTVVVGGAVLLLAWAGGRGIFPEGRWLMYVVLALGGVKLLVEDLVAGRPATLVLSLAVYGAALIVAPRLLRPRV